MANTIIELRHSYVTGNVPSSLANGEIAINTYDGKVFYRGGASNTIQTIERFQGPAGLNGEIQFNDSGVLGADSGLTYNKTTDALTVAGQLLGSSLKSTQSSGDEGGQLDLATAATNSTLLGGVVAIDIYQNKLRIFEGGGTNRGVFIDLANSASAGVGTDLLNPTATPDTIARAQANAAFITANAAFIAANNTANTNLTQNNSITAAFTAANSAGIYANSAFNHANAAFIKANTGGALTVSLTDDSNNFTNVVTSVTGIRFDANSGFDITDLGSGNVKVGMNSTFKTWKITGQSDLIANGLDTIEFVGSNGIVLTSNTLASPKTITFDTSQIFGVANTANTVYVSDSPPNTPKANTLWWQSNTATLKIYYNDGVTSQWVDTNQTYALDIIARNTANAAFIHANAAFNAANSAADTWVRNQANSAFIQANAAFTVANAAFTTANGTIAWDTANAAFIQANTGLIHAQSAFNVVNSAAIAANTPSHVANSAAIYANGAFALANNEAGVNLTQNNSITASFIAANSAGAYANGAFARANNSISANTGGTITGDLSITGNLSVLGNTFTISSTTIVANDTVIILGANNYTSDLLDIGFAAHYNDGSNAHTGLIRDHGTKEWQLFEGYTPEIGANNDININDPSFKLATLNANVHATQILIKGINLLPYVNSSFSLANSNYTSAVTKLDVTNSGSSAYLIDQYSGNNPTIYVRAGETIAFNLNVTGHPFLIRESSGGANTSTGLIHVSTTGVVSTGSNAQGQVTGVLYWKIPFDIVGSTYVYQCGIHGGMVGNIVIEQPTIFAFNQANASFVIANSAAIAANTPSHVANSAAVYANGAFFAANTEAAVNATQNTTIQLAWNHANSAYNQANNSGAGGNIINVYNANTKVFTGTANGTGTTFNLGFTPASQNNVIVSSNGVVQYDYTLSNSTIIFNFAPPSGALIRVQTFGTSSDNSLSALFQTGNLIVYDGNTLVSLSNTNTAGTYGNSTHVPVITTDAYGRVLSVTNTSITGSSGASVSVGDDPPAAPTANSLWWQSNTGELKIYYNDGTSSQWVDAFSSAYSLDQWARDQANAAFNQANTGGGGGGTPVTVSTFQETANGTVSTFDLGFSPASGQILIVSIDGVVQPVTTYTVNTSANTISFTTGPISGEVVYVVGFSNTSAYVINDGSVTYAKLSSSAIASIEGNAIALSIALG